jgi:hypothetical protein
VVYPREVTYLPTARHAFYDFPWKLLVGDRD